MTAESDDDIMDSLFHGAALTAFLQIAADSNCWPPPAEATRRLAYDLYEQALAEKNRRKSAALLGPCGEPVKAEEAEQGKE